MRLVRPSLNRTFGGRRYGLLHDLALGKREAQAAAKKLRRSGLKARVSRLSHGWFVYKYPQ